MHLDLSISPIAQAKKPRCRPLHLRFLTHTLEEISCAICTSYFSTVPKEQFVSTEQKDGTGDNRAEKYGTK